MPDGYSISYDLAGAGGYGNPQNRNPQSIHQDLINGHITPAQAAADYGESPTSLTDCSGTDQE